MRSATPAAVLIWPGGISSPTAGVLLTVTDVRGDQPSIPLGNCDGALLTKRRTRSRPSSAAQLGISLSTPLAMLTSPG